MFNDINEAMEFMWKLLEQHEDVSLHDGAARK